MHDECRGRGAVAKTSVLTGRSPNLFYPRRYYSRERAAPELVYGRGVVWVSGYALSPRYFLRFDEDDRALAGDELRPWRVKPEFESAMDYGVAERIGCHSAVRSSRSAVEAIKE
jgi:hypothetical protein